MHGYIYVKAAVACLFTAIFIGAYASQHIALEDNGQVEYESEIRVAPEQCLQLLSSYRAGGNTWLLKFQNVCGERLYANACIEERPGKFKLHKSGAKIPKYGYWTIYSYEGHAPLSIHLATGAGVPQIPGQCGVEGK